MRTTEAQQTTPNKPADDIIATPAIVSTGESGNGYAKTNLTEKLSRTEARDDSGFNRPIYIIGGRKIAMRTRWEYPAYTGYLTAAVGEDNDPTQMVDPAANIDDRNMTQWQNSYNRFVAAQTDPKSADVIFVSNTPRGVIDAALLISKSSDEGLARLKDEMSNGVYSERALALIDQLIGSMYMDDDGNFRDYIDHDAFALVIAALAGDAESQSIVDTRSRAYKEKHETDLRNESYKRKLWYQNTYPDVEPIDPKEVCIVHSTSYPIERDSGGEVILYPAGQKRKDLLPRATIHFTPNSQVANHYGGSWEDKNRLIVSNLARIMEANGNPVAMSDVDTSFACSPGEHLTMTGAVVIEPSSYQESLIYEDSTNHRVSYKLQPDDQYTEEELAQIKELHSRYPGPIPARVKESPSAYLRECVLRKVMSEMGAHTFLSSGMHYSSDRDFQTAYGKLAAELGVDTAIHANTPESQLESDMAKTFDVAGKGRSTNMYVYPKVAEEMLRQVVANGFIPVTENDPYAWDNGEDFF